MDTKEKYFSNISNRERAIFEGAISMGALFQFPLIWIDWIRQ